MRFFLACLILAVSILAHADDDSDFTAAREAFRTGQIQRLPDYAQRLQNSVLLPYVQYWLISSQLKTASPDDIRYFIDRNSDTPLSNKLRSNWLHQLGQQQDWTTYLNEYPLAVNPDMDLQCYALQARIAQGQPLALKDGVALWFTGKEMPASCDDLFDMLIAKQYISQNDIWQRIRLLLANNNTATVLKIEAYLSAPSKIDHKLLNAASNAPEALLNSNRLDLHQRESRELALYAINRMARSNAANAVLEWERIKSEFPADDRHYAWGQLAVYGARQHLPAALSWFGKLDDHELSDEQLAWKTRAAMLIGNWLTVRDSILSMSENARNEAAWRYWLARAYKTENKTYQANLLLAPLSREYNFYGLLAEEELGTVAGSPVINFNVAGDEVSAISRIPAIQRALQLYRLDFRTEANNEWNWATRNFDDRRLLAAAEFARQQNWLDRAINTADRTQQLHNFDLRFLAPYRDIAHQYAKEYGLDEAWVYGLMRQESRFVSQAKSGVGASGIMQIMPATARWIANKLGIRHFQTEHLHQLETNMQFGMFYLKTIQQSLDNSDVLATAAYNAGPGRARRWRGENATEGAIYVENIPFTETRDYVKKVISNAVFYARRFNQPETSIKTRLGTIAGASTPALCGGSDENAPSCDN
ncbi:MAG: transglycosylase SLT domain-containing protein [Sulfuriferula sp.]|nr:transglycosylase SLT domain-containing protein [Sulfuriferula sp.]